MCPEDLVGSGFMGLVFFMADPRLVISRLLMECRIPKSFLMLS
jgi:hypothetical protein